MVERGNHGKVQIESLEEEATHVLDEARMVLPGIQALFGFQLVAVFNQRFASDLAPWQQQIHLAALFLVAISVAAIMTPAAYHRQAERGRISERFLRLASGLITAAMLPLAAGISLDLFVVAGIVTGQQDLSAALGALLFGILLGAWFAFPRWSAIRIRREARSR
jgi:membrane associated rhomboid family serine protease